MGLVSGVGWYDEKASARGDGWQAGGLGLREASEWEPNSLATIAANSKD